MRVGGVIVIDNVLWKGKVADPLVCNEAHHDFQEQKMKTYIFGSYNIQVNDPTTVTMRNFNYKIFKDRRVDISMVMSLFFPKVFLINPAFPCLNPYMPVCHSSGFCQIFCSFSFFSWLI